MEPPLVSVVCLSYNQAKFIEEAVHSVLNQTYPNIELIVTDDASTDLTPEKIKQLKETYPQIKTLLLTENVGNCKAFNKAMALTKGNYLIDLAADDVLLPTRIEEGVKTLQRAGNEFGVHFSDAEWISESGGHLYFHSDKFPHNTIPQGNIYKEVISRYFICPPTVMFSREVIDFLGGYDESLAYEDFDFLIRSSRQFKFAYTSNVLVKKRVVKNAMAGKQFRVFSNDSLTTYTVCKKILSLNQTTAEQRALRKRILYEIKLNIRLINPVIVFRFFLLWLRNQAMRYG
jgi:glycosyltransferase involved in cell wall biosynthesis